jgi:hypothetical protein
MATAEGAAPARVAAASQEIAVAAIAAVGKEKRGMGV